MKKFLFFAALIAVSAFFATSCHQSVVIPLGDDLASFTKMSGQTTELVGVKNTANDVVLVEPVYDAVFYKDSEGNWGDMEPETGAVCVEPQDPNLVFAIDEKGNVAFYRGSKTLYRLDNGGKKAVTKANFNAMVKEAEQNKTPWPQTGVGVVKVKRLR